MTRNKRGFTLIELLATLTIISIVGSIIWNVFYQGYHYSQKAMSINTMQQEANLIITQLTKIHQTEAEYSILPPHTGHQHDPYCEFQVKTDSRTETFKSTRFCYKLIYQGNPLTTPLVVKPTDPENGDIELTITVSDQNDSRRTVDVDVLLYRLKGDR